MIIKAFLLLACYIFTSCASIVGGVYKTVSVKTVPSDAEVSVYNRKGEEVYYKSRTPALIPLKRGAGLFKGEQYLFIFFKDGYKSGSMSVDSTVNGFYFGNIIIGPVGLLIDPVTGAMWTFPDNINFNLIKNNDK